MSWNKTHIILFQVILAVVGMTSCVHAQENLIVNGNLDTITNCPQNPGEIQLAYPWMAYSICSPDLLSVCSSNSFTTIPSAFGFQIPFTNDGYLHLAPIFIDNHEDFTNPYRESVIGSFRAPLENKWYHFECYVNFSDMPTNPNDNRLAINAIDIKLLDSIEHPNYGFYPYMDTTGVLNLNPMNAILKDTLNWLKLEICFLAKGGENFFALGTFRDTSQIEYELMNIQPSATSYFASYFFDSFSLIECDTCCGQVPPVAPVIENLLVKNSVGTTANPVQFQPVLPTNATAQLTLYDSRGRLVLQHTFSDNTPFILPPQLQMAMYHFTYLSSTGFQQQGKVVVAE